MTNDQVSKPQAPNAQAKKDAAQAGPKDRERGGGEAPNTKSKEELDRELDKELKDSFPSSDPPSASQPSSRAPAGDPKAKP